MISGSLSEELTGAKDQTWVPPPVNVSRCANYINLFIETVTTQR
jgi:hypothetical protein